MSVTNKKPDCSSCLNTNCLVKRYCLDEQFSPLIDKKHTFQCKKGQQFIIEGAPVHGLYFIFSGKVKILKTGINGREQIVRFSQDGDIIGYRGFGAGKYYSISAVAIEDCVLCNFTNDTLYEMLQTITKFTYGLMMFYAEELNISETKVKTLAQMTVRERVIDAILYIHRKFGQKKKLLNLQLSRKEVADFAGTTEEQAIRVISSLKKDGLLNFSGKKIGIADVDLLKKEISEHNFFLDS